MDISRARTITFKPKTLPIPEVPEEVGVPDGGDLAEMVYHEDIMVEMDGQNELEYTEYLT